MVGAGAHDSPFVRCFSGRRGADPYDVAVRICPRICFCGVSISKNAFRRFESVVGPEMMREQSSARKCIYKISKNFESKNLVKYSAYAECEIISLRKLWNISRRLRLCSMWNEICPHSRQRIFHICEANISQRSYFTCLKGKFRWKMICSRFRCKNCKLCELSKNYTWQYGHIGI